MAEVTAPLNSLMDGEENMTSYEYYEYEEGFDLNSHPAIRIIYRIIIPIICVCGILGIILTGKYQCYTLCNFHNKNLVCTNLIVHHVHFSLTVQFWYSVLLHVLH